MPRIKKGDRVIFEGSNDPTVIYTVEKAPRNSGLQIRSHPDSRGCWGSASRDRLILVTPELEQFMSFLNTQIATKNPEERIEILQKVFKLLEIF
jgi:hypothetical protein